MLSINDLYGRKVYVPKKAKKKKDAEPDEIKLKKLGKVHMAVFSPDGREVVGFLVTRPDVVGMVKRADAFLAWDSFRILDDGTLCLIREDDGLDDAARKRLGVDWDSCVMWEGMDAKTASGKKLGYVSNADFDAKTGQWIVENHGVDPDILIDNDPIKEQMGEDQQLNKAIEVIMQELKDRKPLPKVPAPRTFKDLGLKQ